MATEHAHGDGLPTGKGVSFTGGVILGFVATAVMAFIIMIGMSPPVVRPPMMQPAATPASPTTPDGAVGDNAVASATAGADLAATYACAACHSIDGVDGAGPTWLGMAGSERTMEGGEVIVADRDYLVQSIIDPGVHIVDGFFDAMPKDFGDRLTPDEVDALVGYIESFGS